MSRARAKPRRRTRALAARVPNQPAPENPQFSSPVWWGQSGFIPKDLVLTPDEQFAVSVAWACIRAIVDPIAASELKVYQESDGERLDDTGWLWWLLNVDPHPQFTSQGWSEINLTRCIATGNAYAYIRRYAMTGRPFSLQPLDPARMLAEGDGGDGTVYVYMDPNNGRVEMPDADVLHFRGPRTTGFFGDSPLARAASALALAKAQEQYATAYYANGAYPGVILKPPAGGGAPTKEQKAEARAEWNKLFGGPRKKGGMGVTDPGWDISVIQTDAEKSQVVAARQEQVAEIARFFGVPLHMIGVPGTAQGYGRNLAELGKGFVQQTLQPWATRIQEELRRKLMPDRRGQTWFIEYDLSRLMKGDEESIARAEEIALRNGVLTINEARRARGLPTVKGGDTTMVNGKPIDQVLEPPEPPEPVTTPDAPGTEDMPMRQATASWSVALVQPPASTAVLARHAARVKARASDLASKGRAEDVPKHVEQLRVRARGELRAVGETREIAALDCALAAVENGVEPAKALAHLRGDA